MKVIKNLILDLCDFLKNFISAMLIITSGIIVYSAIIALIIFIILAVITLCFSPFLLLGFIIWIL